MFENISASLGTTALPLVTYEQWLNTLESEATQGNPDLDRIVRFDLKSALLRIS